VFPFIIITDVSEYGPREGYARDKKKDKGLSYQRRLRNRQAKKVQRELDGLGLDDFDEERVAREEYNKEHGVHPSSAEVCSNSLSLSLH
jgi:hypothetical protein